MRRTKTFLLISIGCAGVAMALLLAAAVVAHLLANRDLVKSYIVTKAAQATGGELDYERIEIGYLPLPHLIARQIHLIQPQAFSLRAQELAVYPRILAMLKGRLSVRRLTLNASDIHLRLPQAADKSPSTAKADKTGAGLVPAAMNSHIGALFNVLSAVEPGTRVEIDQGQATVDLPDGPPIHIRTIRAIAESTPRGLSLDLSCASDPVGELTVQTKADVKRLKAEGKISLADINPRLILSHLSLPAGISVSDTRAKATLEFTVNGTDNAGGRYQIQIPTLTVKRFNRELNLSAVTLSGEMGVENSRLSLRLETIAARQPALSLSANAILTQDRQTGDAHLTLEAAAEQLDVSVAGDVTRALAGDLEYIRTAFGVARAGMLAAPAYSADFEHDRDGWHLTKMAATGRLSRGLVSIPAIDATVENVAGEIVYEDDHVEFLNLGGRFEGAAFKALDVAIDWANQATLSIRSPSIDVEAAPFFTWLTGFEELAEVRQTVSVVGGRAAVSNLDISGPLTQPGKWDFHVTGSPRDLVLKTSHTPFEIKLSGGEIVYQPGHEQSSHVEIECLDAAMVVSHRSSGIVDPKTISVQIDGSMGADALAWLHSMAPMPDHLQITPPVSLTGVDLTWNRGAGISLSGGLKTAGGVALTVDLTHSPEALEIRKIQFSDGFSKATLSASRRDASIELTFSGNVEKHTVDHLLKTNRLLSGKIDGDFQAHINTKAPLNSKFVGRLNGSGLNLPDLAKIPIRVDRFSVVGHGNRFDILPSELTLDGTRLRVDGTLVPRQKALVFDINVDTDELDLARLQSLQPVDDTSVPADAEKPPPAVVPSGTIHFKTRALTYGDFTWSPVEADMRIESDSTFVTINQARLCGISTTGDVNITPQGIGFNISPLATKASLQKTSECLWDKKVRADARYDLVGNVFAAPSKQSPLSTLSGHMAFSSQNGRIYHSSILLKIFSVMNITEIFTGGKSDLAEEGYGYTQAWVKATLGAGDVFLDEILLDGNALKITGQGSIDLNDATADIVILAAPLKTVDRIVEKIPIIKYITGGSLISVPLRLHGKLRDLSVVPLPPSAVGKGLLHFMERTLKAPFKMVEGAREIVSEHAPRDNGSPDAPPPREP